MEGESFSHADKLIAFPFGGTMPETVSMHSQVRLKTGADVVVPVGMEMTYSPTLYLISPESFAEYIEAFATEGCRPDELAGIVANDVHVSAEAEWTRVRISTRLDINNPLELAYYVVLRRDDEEAPTS